MRKNICLVIVGVLILSGCSDFLDRNPKSELSPKSYFQDKAEMSNWNAGIYDAFQSALSQKQVLYGDVRSDNVHTTGYATSWIYTNALLPDKNECSWQPFYQAITRSNVGIENYPEIPNILESEYAPYMGQCYAMRAFMYFWGTRVWGRMPIITKSWDGSLGNIAIPRASLEEVKTQIMNDIDEAIRYFRISNTSNKIYLGLEAMYALRMEVHMWYFEYKEAIETSDYFINNKNFALATDATEWKQMFLNPEGSKEVIFAMDWSFESDKANGGWPGQLGADNTNNGFQLSREIFNEFIDRRDSGEGNDSRFANMLDTVKLYYQNGRLPLTYATYDIGSGKGVEKCTKYCGIDDTREYDSDKQVFKTYYKLLDTNLCEQKLVFSRLSNILLLRAEALNQLDRGNEALDIVNQIRERAGYLKDVNTEISANNKRDVESAILLERQLEFYGEGQRWFDLMRTGRLIEVMDPVYSARQAAGGAAITGFGKEGTKYWPINYREFESNTALYKDQNDPYNER